MTRTPPPGRRRPILSPPPTGRSELCHNRRRNGCRPFPASDRYNPATPTRAQKEEP